MTRRRTSTRSRQQRQEQPADGPVVVTRADGSSYTIPPYDDVALRVVRAGGRPRTGSISPRLRRRIFQRDSGRCQDCQRECTGVPWEIDHIVPRAVGGRTEWTNLRLLCRTCNRLKGASIGVKRDRAAV